MNTKSLPERSRLIILILVGMLYSVGVAYLFANLPNPLLTDDFFPRWHASRMLLTRGRSLYDWENARQVSAVTGWPLVHQLGYYYPAYLLLFTAPLSMVPYPAAGIIWTVCGLWCLWLGTGILARSFRPHLSINSLTLLLVLITTSVPVFQHTLYAQFNTLAVLALALTWQALRRKKYLLAGIWAGGLLFKPQATLLSLVFLLIWSALKRERWPFGAGLALIGLALWGLAQAFEPGWVLHFWQALDSYEPIRPALNKIWNPHQILSLGLLAATFWFIWRLRRVSAGSSSLAGLLIWTMSLNALIVPAFGMLHIVQLESLFALFLGALAHSYPSFTSRAWMGTAALFIAGLLAFILPLLLTGHSGLQISSAELVYKLAMPIALGLASLPLMIGFSDETIANHTPIQ